MTDLLLDYDPNDSGEIPRLVGETRIVIDTGEKTQRIDRGVIHASVVRAIPRRVIEIDETVVFHIPETIGIVPDLAAAQPVAPWERALNPETERLSLLGSVAGVDGDLRPAAPGPRPGPLPPNPPAPAPKLRRSVPYVMPADRRPWSGARHAKPAPLWARAAVLVGGAMAAGAFVALAVLAVAW